jgi:hypothetical protein
MGEILVTGSHKGIWAGRRRQRALSGQWNPIAIIPVVTI